MVNEKTINIPPQMTFWGYFLIPAWLWLAFEGVKTGSYWNCAGLIVVSSIILLFFERDYELKMRFTKKKGDEAQNRLTHSLSDKLFVILSFFLVFIIAPLTTKMFWDSGSFKTDFTAFSTFAVFVIAILYHVSIMVRWAAANPEKFKTMKRGSTEKLMEG